MDTETILRGSAIAVGALILLSSWVDWSALVGRVISALTPTPEESKVVIPVVPVKDEDEQFLHIIDLWHQLRSECEDYGLPKALVAIDKVFPLLNDRIEESND